MIDEKEKMFDFALWLEFEEIDPENWNKENEFANVQINFSDGRKYGINVWTYKFLETAIVNSETLGKT